jgi:hypothetical protein
MAIFYDIKSSENAYKRLKEQLSDDIQVEYDCDLKDQLSSINESSDSGSSEKNEDCSERERKARESLETTKEKIKQEYESLEDPIVLSEEQKNEVQGQMMSSASHTMPLPFISAFANNCHPFNATMQFLSPLEQTHNFSDCSFDNDTLSEG